MNFGFALFKNARNRSRVQQDARPWLTGGTPVLVTPASVLSPLSVSFGNCERSVLCLQEKKMLNKFQSKSTSLYFFTFFIEGKYAANTERKPISSWGEWIKEITGKQQKKDFFFPIQYYACVLLPGIVIFRISNPVHFGRKSRRWQLYSVTVGHVTVWAGHGFLNIYNSFLFCIAGWER